VCADYCAGCVLLTYKACVTWLLTDAFINLQQKIKPALRKLC